MVTFIEDIQLTYLKTGCKKLGYHFQISHLDDGDMCSSNKSGLQDNASQMTPQKTMWQPYSKFQPEEKASVLQVSGMKDLFFEKFILLCNSLYTNIFLIDSIKLIILIQDFAP